MFLLLGAPQAEHHLVQLFSRELDILMADICNYNWHNLDELIVLQIRRKCVLCSVAFSIDLWPPLPSGRLPVKTYKHSIHDNHRINVSVILDLFNSVHVVNFTKWWLYCEKFNITWPYWQTKLSQVIALHFPASPLLSSAPGHWLEARLSHPVTLHALSPWTLSNQFVQNLIQPVQGGHDDTIHISHTLNTSTPENLVLHTDMHMLTRCGKRSNTHSE